MFCTNCGNQLKEDDVFCTQCGQKTERENESAVVPAQASADVDNAPAQVQRDAHLQKKGSKTPVIVAACVVVVVIIAALLWLFAFGGIGMFAGDGTANDLESQIPATQEEEEELISVPYVKGLSFEAAKEIIVYEGLIVGSVTEEESDAVEKGDIISQSVAPYSDVSEGTVVDLVVSIGEAKHAYEIVGGLRTWDEAQQYCKQHGGELACINTEAEWEEVLAAAKATDYKVFWLGGYFDGESFKWVDGSPFMFSDWAVGEPNNDEGVEDKLALFDVNGSWAWYDVPNDLGSTYSADKCALIMEVG